jgi:hypothetical protein
MSRPSEKSLTDWELCLSAQLEKVYPTPPTAAEKLIASYEKETKEILSGVVQIEDGEPALATPETNSTLGWNPETEKEWVEISSCIRSHQKNLMKIRNSGSVRVDKLRAESRKKIREQIAALQPRFQELEEFRLASQKSAPRK